MVNEKVLKDKAEEILTAHVNAQLDGLNVEEIRDELISNCEIGVKSVDDVSIHGEYNYTGIKDCDMQITEANVSTYACKTYKGHSISINVTLTLEFTEYFDEFDGDRFVSSTEFGGYDISFSVDDGEDPESEVKLGSDYSDVVKHIKETYSKDRRTKNGTD